VTVIFRERRNKIFARFRARNLGDNVRDRGYRQAGGVTFSRATSRGHTTDTEIEVRAREDATHRRTAPRMLRLSAEGRWTTKEDSSTWTSPSELRIENPPPAVLVAVSPKVRVIRGPRHREVWGNDQAALASGSGVPLPHNIRTA